jgi:hypothetical protein
MEKELIALAAAKHKLEAAIKDVQNNLSQSNGVGINGKLDASPKYYPTR